MATLRSQFRPTVRDLSGGGEYQFPPSTRADRLLRTKLASTAASVPEKSPRCFLSLGIVPRENRHHGRDPLDKAIPRALNRPQMKRLPIALCGAGNPSTGRVFS